MRDEVTEQKEKIDKLYGKGLWDLEYQLKRTKPKIDSLREIVSNRIKYPRKADLEKKATEVETKIQQLRLKINVKGNIIYFYFIEKLNHLG